jgi:hypothetical protein
VQDTPFYFVRVGLERAAYDRTRERLHEPYNSNIGLEENELLVSAELAVKREPFSTESLVSRLKSAIPDTPIVEQTVLTDYDSYYYSRRDLQPLPALRVKFADPMETWVYVDPKTSRVVAEVHRLNRLERWLYSGRPHGRLVLLRTRVYRLRANAPPVEQQSTGVRHGAVCNVQERRQSIQQRGSVRRADPRPAAAHRRPLARPSSGVWTASLIPAPQSPMTTPPPTSAQAGIWGQKRLTGQ